MGHSKKLSLCLGISFGGGLEGSSTFSFRPVFVCVKAYIELGTCGYAAFDFRTGHLSLAMPRKLERYKQHEKALQAR